MLSRHPKISEVPTFDQNVLGQLDEIIQKFSVEDAERVKAIERTTNHDVKAVEYFLKEKVCFWYYSGAHIIESVLFSSKESVSCRHILSLFTLPVHLKILTTCHMHCSSGMLALVLFLLLE